MQMRDALKASFVLAALVTSCIAQSAVGPASNASLVSSTIIPELGARGPSPVNVSGTTNTQSAGSSGETTGQDLSTAGVRADVAGKEGALRLAARVDVNGYATGTLQVFLDGSWGAVCSSFFDIRDATVACRQLGLTGGLVEKNPSGFIRPMPASPDEIAPFALENLGCVGDESMLVDCPARGDQDRIMTTSAGTEIDYTYHAEYSLPLISPDDCNPFRESYVHLACGTDVTVSEGAIRLANGAVASDGSAEYGRLEVFHRGGWGTVCDKAFVSRFQKRAKFSRGAVTVACQQLGYQEGVQIQTLESSLSEGVERVPIVLPGLNCRGSGKSLDLCPDFDIGLDTDTCSFLSNVHLICFSGSNADMDGATRLVGGSANRGQRYENGRLEVFYRGFWSNVCNADRFTPDSAQVACRALGYDGGAMIRFTQPQNSQLNQVLFEDLPVALGSVDCDGSENSIVECANKNAFLGACNKASTSTILACADTAPGCDRLEGSTEGAIRLRGGFGTICDPVHSGFIEVLHEDEWGSICTTSSRSREVIGYGNKDQLDDSFVADVACRQLGFPHGTRVDPLTADRRPLQEDEST